MRYAKMFSVLTLVVGVVALAHAQDGKGKAGDPAAKKKGGGGPAMTLTTPAFPTS